MRSLVAGLVMLGFVVGGCTYSVGSTSSPASSPRPTTGPPTGTAKLIAVELGKVRVVGARPDVPGYKRDQFGQTWTDDHTGRGGHNGCDTRVICTIWGDVT